MNTCLGVDQGVETWNLQIWAYVMKTCFHEYTLLTIAATPKTVYIAASLWLRKYIFCLSHASISGRHLWKVSASLPYPPNVDSIKGVTTPCSTFLILSPYSRCLCHLYTDVRLHERYEDAFG